jgi:serine/threonine-protein kinase/serine/threonine-protein kinase PknK
MSGALSVSYGYGLAAIAESEQLDVAGAEAHLRHARRIALLPSGRPTYVAKLAGALLGDVLYERGHLDDAEQLLDDAYELGAEGGLVDFMLAAFGTGARLKLARGDKPGAYRRLDEGLQIARTLKLPRLEARLLCESVRIAARSGDPVSRVLARRITTHSAWDGGEIAGEAADLAEDAHIRLRLVEDRQRADGDACRRARARLERIDRQARPRAHLLAAMQFALCLVTAGDVDDARRIFAPALRTCAALGLNRLVVDEDPHLLRLAADMVQTDEFDSADTANVRDFVLGLVEAPSI